MNDNHTDIKREKRNFRTATVLLIVIAVLFFAVLVFVLYKVNVLELPDFIEELISTQTPEQPFVAQIDEERVFDALIDIGSDNYDAGMEYDTILTYGIDSFDDEQFTELISQSPYYEEYSLVLKVTVYGEMQQTTNTNYIWRSGEKYRIDTYRGGKHIRSVVCDGEKVAITDYVTYSDTPYTDAYGNSDVTRIYPISDIFTLETQAGIPSPKDFISDSNIENLSVSLVRQANNNLICVSYDRTDMPQKETLYISPEYGLIVNAESRFNGILTYYVSCSSMQEGLSGYSGSSEDLFKCKY